MKKLLSYLLMFYAVTTISAKDYKYLNLVLKDKTIICYEIENKNKYITFNDSCMIIDNIAIFMDKIDKYYVSDENNASSSVNNTKLTHSEIIGNTLFVRNEKSGYIYIYI